MTADRRFAITSGLALSAGLGWLALRAWDLTLAGTVIFGREPVPWWKVDSMATAWLAARWWLGTRGPVLLLFAIELAWVVDHALFTWVHARLPPVASGPPSTPVVGVLVPCHDEPLAVVGATLTAAAALDWPDDRLEILVLDDGADPARRALVDALAAERPGVRMRWRSRVADGGVRRGYKAGNLNFGLSQLSADVTWVYLLDADQVTSPDALRALCVGLDDGVGFVQAPQVFDVPGDDPWDRGAREFHLVTQAYRAARGALMLTGTCALVSRAALTRIGGFVEHTVTEDLATGLKLQLAGFAGRYHPGAVARGLVPTRLADVLRQRLRWAQGSYQLLRRLPGLVVRGDRTLPGSPRLGASAAATYLSGILGFITPILLFLLLALPAAVILADLDAVLMYATPSLIGLLAFTVLRDAAREVRLRRTPWERATAAWLPALMGPVCAHAAITGLTSAPIAFRTTPKARTRGVGGADLAALSPAALVLCANTLAVAWQLREIAVTDYPLAHAALDYGPILALATYAAAAAACALGVWPAPPSGASPREVAAVAPRHVLP